MNQTNTEKLKELTERFKNNIVSYKSGQYNETQARQEFINPLFKLIDWDVDNEQGYAEAYKDVVHEDASKDSLNSITEGIASMNLPVSDWEQMEKKIKAL
jgi:hypothetical protein